MLKERNLREGVQYQQGRTKSDFLQQFHQCALQKWSDDVTNFDLPAGQWSACHSFLVQACRSPAVLQRELALKSRHIQKDGQDKLGLVQNPIPIHKLHKSHSGREGGSHEW